MRVVLVEPQIPPNTGNIARLCAAFEVELNLVGPLGFRLEDRYLKRAGLDYWPHVRLALWPDFTAFRRRKSAPAGERLIMTSAKRPGCAPLQKFSFLPEDALVFGAETHGLADEIFSLSAHSVRIPIKTMDEGGARSLNLSTACGIVLFQALVSSGLLA